VELFVRSILVVFFSNIDLSNRIEVAASLNKYTGNLFNGESAILPIPEDAPHEIPRIILDNKEKIFGCVVSPKRLEFSFKQKEDENRKLEEVQEDFLNQLSNIAKAAKTELKAKVERLGIIVRLVMFPDENPADFLIRKFLTQGMIVDPRELHLDFLHRFDLGDFKVNRWHRFRCFSPEAEEALEKPKALLIDTDINTVPEIKYDFGAEQTPAFCSQVFTFVKSDLESLFVREV